MVQSRRNSIYCFPDASPFDESAMSILKDIYNCTKHSVETLGLNMEVGEGKNRLYL